MQFNKKNLPFKAVTETEFERFTAALDTLFQKNDTGSSEENYKINFVEFLHHIFQNKNHINALPLDGNMGIDLAIHLDKSGDSKAGVHFEIKKPSNVSEMISPENLNRKAFHESVLYFLFDKITNKNDESKYVIISNLEDFYIFDATEFTRLFYRDNKAYSNEFEAWKAGQRNDNTTKHLYDFIAQKMMQGDKQITGHHIRLADYRAHLRTLREAPNNNEARIRLAQLCHVFSPQFLLKKSDINDSNTLNKDFYHELLHIIGLKEVKEKGKKLIKRKPAAEREYASMLENTIGELKAEGITTNEDEQFDIALELCLTWVNRILFLKLLESQLYQYNNEDDEYKFLAHSKISGYDQLKTLFFQVLAVQPQEREAHIKDQYAKIPYLNSSLFEPTKLERKAVRISSLKDNFGLSIHPKTKLQDRFADGKCPTLEYLLRFLDAYDFGAVGKQKLIRDERKPLINAAVLGLIFEKINGYKEGSFYTPGFVTMYMCRETIRRAALQKINNQLGWNCQDLGEVRNKIDNREERKAVNETINTLTICDPAVGSGHFLVSALNEIIALKAELRVILDSEGNRVKCSIEIDNDELIIKDEDDVPFTYHLNPKGKIIQARQDIQQALFREKQTIIENCLFGVDINPNSVKICRLRLWIELLKNAFYTPESKYHHLETLPNIDINIKQGNSLISRFPLDENLSDVFKKQKYNIQTYKNTVAAYRSTRDRDTKRQLQNFLDDIKDQFQTTLASRDPLRKRMSKLRGEILLLENPDLFTNGKSKPKPNGIDKKKKELAELEQQKRDIESNKIYENAFEWRFEFPEVLDANGEYVGFDLIIGNPPYGLFNKKQNKTIALTIEKEVVNALKTKYPEATGGVINASRIFYALSFKLSALNGYQSMIIPFGVLTDTTSARLRKHIFKKHQLILVEAFPERDNMKRRVFEDVKMSTAILITGNAPQKLQFDMGISFDRNINTQIRSRFDPDELIKLSPELAQIPLTDTLAFNLLVKIYSNENVLKFGLVSKCFTGEVDMTFGKHAITRNKKNEKLYKGVQIDRYLKKENQNEISQGDIEFLNIQRFKTKYKGKKLNDALCRRIALQGLTGVNEKHRLKGTIIEGGSYLTNSCNYLLESEEVDLEVILALFNSKLTNFIFKAKSTSSNVNGYEVDDLPFYTGGLDLVFKEKVTQILALKREDPQADTTALEAEIDQMVYDLYGLTKKEIAIIESAVK